MPKRGRRPGLDRQRIAEVAIGLADAGGLGAVALQRVAETMGVTKMALYSYVAGKAELVALMADTAVGEPPASESASKSWRQRLVVLSLVLYERFRQHPWVVEATTGARHTGPNEVAWLERFLTPLRDTRLTGAERLDLTVTLIGHVRSIAMQAAVADDRPEHVMAAGLMSLVDDRRDRFPMVAATLESIEPETEDHALRFGLDLILSGAEHLDAQRAGVRC